VNLFPKWNVAQLHTKLDRFGRKKDRTGQLTDLPDRCPGLLSSQAVACRRSRRAGTGESCCEETRAGGSCAFPGFKLPKMILKF